MGRKDSNQRNKQTRLWSMYYCLSLIALILVTSHLHFNLYITYISGIGFFVHKLRNLDDHTAAFIVKKLLEGCRRSRSVRDVRAPLTEAILQRICSALSEVCYSPYGSYLSYAIFLTAYIGLLLVSEVVFTSPMQANRSLLFSDVKFIRNPSALLVAINAS